MSSTGKAKSKVAGVESGEASKHLPKFQQIQHQFSAHIRNPDAVPLRRDVDGRRMRIYRDLFYNNINGFISNGFPVLRKYYSDPDWHQLVRGFYSEHTCCSPYFLEISQEFLKYLKNEHVKRPCDPPFMYELAHYEWVELALSVADETLSMDGIDPNADLMAGVPILSPLAWCLSYTWPVHRLGPGYWLETAPQEPTYIVVYRDRNDKVRFVVVNAVTALLLQVLEEQPTVTGEQACRIVSEAIAHPNLEHMMTGGQHALQDLQAKGILLGVRRPE